MSTSKTDLLNHPVNFYRVRLGSMFYAGKLVRRDFDKEVVSFEFVDDEEVADILMIESEANEIAEICGGVAVKRVKPMKELSRLHLRNIKYRNEEVAGGVEL
ncbi:hypothetical protein [Priestia megaterium]|uniref:hypothetical protein n=1 Tax=Priestia megaterium TaxID=1404 RepID=UPI000BFD9F8A|nr:hypothetical protein [Priestia megaterium]PGQ88334.1 hypothetical protein COA18_05235 [Priestia megaterium]